MFLNPHEPIDRHRVNLPHWQQGETWIFVTWRLADSLPAIVVEKLAAKRADWLKNHPQPWSEQVRREYNRKFTLGFEKLLDDAHGECILTQPAHREIVSAALHHFDGSRYCLDCFVIMPNHVHVLFHPTGGHLLQDILHSWKRFTAREINKVRSKAGVLWQREYWDRLIRTEKQFQWTQNYIARNPEKLAPDTFTLWKRDVPRLCEET
jgi:REP element-mobilizing transposase RayT